MNAIEQWIHEGRVQGMQQGMQQSLEETARSMLMKGLDDQLIQEITKLSNEKLHELKRKMRH